MGRTHMNSMKAGALIALIAAASPAAADDSSAAMLAFGLVGAWSVDCSTNMALPCDDALEEPAAAAAGAKDLAQVLVW